MGVATLAELDDSGNPVPVDVEGELQAPGEEKEKLAPLDGEGEGEEEVGELRGPRGGEEGEEAGPPGAGEEGADKPPKAGSGDSMATVATLAELDDSGNPVPVDVEGELQAPGEEKEKLAPLDGE